MPALDRRTRVLLAALFACVLAPPCRGGVTSFVETFDGGSNEGGWTWGFGDTIVANGGNPGAYLDTDGLDTFAPQPQTTSGGPFIGNYRSRGVTSLGIDLITFRVDFSAEERPLSLLLVHDNDTPDDPFDDTAAYFMGPNVPLPDEGWLAYDFAVPSQESALPVGWQLLNLGDSGSPAQHSWDQVIQHVSQVRFFYGDPTLFFIFQQWGLGLDNVRIVSSTQPPTTERFVTLCHQPPGNPANAHTITVGAMAVPAHLQHGDVVGACSGGRIDRTGQAAQPSELAAPLVDRSGFAPAPLVAPPATRSGKGRQRG
ncbi:MAG TPA: hypothetical protein VJS92_08935 [Candidatus Polarisedimenticolaceae bacterium]|nr:hypothetical protein [Candidatus Polarisedimenticolaceae bacterium]